MAKLIWISIAFFVTLGIGAQNDQWQALNDSIVYSDGSLERQLSGYNLPNLNMYHDARLDSLMLLQKEVNKAKNGIKGYRVQMFRGNHQGDSKLRAREIQGMVLTEFPDLEVEVFYQSPFWRVQVGSYRMRNEAMKTQALLIEKFREMENNISIVPTIIKFPRL